MRYQILTARLCCMHFITSNEVLACLYKVLSLSLFFLRVYIFSSGLSLFACPLEKILAKVRVLHLKLKM